jgi:UDP-N-acetylmuramoylalanine--D-glutamate ligase
MIPVRGFEGKQVAVFGLARTGLAAARALAAGGARPVVWDEKPMAREAAKAEGLELCDLTTADWSQFAALMLSPGVPLTHPHPHWTVERAKAAGVEIVGDVELFARTVNLAPDHKRPKVVAITGTNGKSTTTALVGHICRVAGRDTRVGGNIGYGVLGLDDMHGGSVFVLELSSYQLDLTSSLRADASVILNISPDHLDRHGGMEGYVAAKRRILLNQGKGDTAVIGVDDPWGQRICTEITAANRRTIVPISASKAMGRGVYALQGLLYDATGERAVEIADLLRARSLPGRHNWQNAAAAFAATHAASVPLETILEGLRTFPGLAHRQQLVAERDGIRFVNDSKATNADAASKALVCYDPIYWIIGGQPKEGGLDGLEPFMPRIRHAFVIGQASEQFATWLSAHGVAYTLCGNLETAVPAATTLARAEKLSGATVLLSPACASWDQFKSFEHRGEVFATLVAAALEQKEVAP